MNRATRQNGMGDAAARLVSDRGWAVFPLVARGKIPLISKENGGRGCLDASTDMEAVRAWWAESPNANVGVATGSASGVFVLDIDATPPKQGGMTGPEALARLEEIHGRLPGTLTSSTGGGGEHRWFRLPYGRKIGNRARIKVDGQATGLDCRADGGYVAAPPSVHPSGRVYAWVGESDAVADAPAWLVDLLAPERKPVSAELPKVAHTADADRFRAYAETALDGACGDIMGCGEGARHDMIRDKALWIGRLIAGGCIGEGEAVAALEGAGIATGKDAREVRRAVEWGISKGKEDPYRPPDREIAPRVFRGPGWDEPPPETDAPPWSDEDVAAWTGSVEQGAGVTDAAPVKPSPLSERHVEAIRRARELVKRILTETGAEQVTPDELRASGKRLADAVPDIVVLAAVAPGEWEAVAASLSMVRGMGGHVAAVSRAVRAGAGPLVKELREAKREARQPVARGKRRDVPEIIVTNRQAEEVIDDAWSAVLTANDPPVLFRQGSGTTRLVREDDAVTITAAEPVHVLSRLIRVARWVQVKRTADGVETSDAPRPPEFVAPDMAVAPDVRLPIVDSVAYGPVFDRGGRLLATSGYHPSARLWIEPTPDLAGGLPTLTLAEAEEVIGDWLADFPFEGPADACNAVAFFLLLLTRRMVSGPTPLHLIEAPQEGTGKTLLGRVLCAGATGREPCLSAFAPREEERQKRITSALASGAPVVFLDNVKGTVESPSLELATTTMVWSDRILGVSRDVTVPVTAAWLATGNNLDPSADLARRIVPIRLARKVETPADATGFRHADIMAWTLANRPRLVAAGVAMVNHWQASGSPRGRATMGSYEAWAGVIGGILTSAGVPGFLDNLQAWRQKASGTRDDWGAFVARWQAKCASEGTGTYMTAIALAKIADGDGREMPLLGRVLGHATTDRSRATAMGMALAKVVGRVFDGMRVAPKLARDGTLYGLEPV